MKIDKKLLGEALGKCLTGNRPEEIAEILLAALSEVLGEKTKNKFYADHDIPRTSLQSMRKHKNPTVGTTSQLIQAIFKEDQNGRTR